jgi:hypothetical protein
MSRRKLDFEPKAFVPIVLALLLVVIYGAAINVFVLCQKGWFGGCEPFGGVPEALQTLLRSHSYGILAADVRAYSSRLLWTLTVGLCVLFSLAGLLLGGHVIASSLNPGNVKRGAWKTLLSLLVSVGVAGLFLASHAGNPAHPWRQFMHARLVGEYPSVMGWTPRLDVLGLVVGLFLALASTSLLICTYKQTDFKEETFRGLVKRSRALLYIGALLLVASVARAIFLFRWSLDYIQVQDEPSSAARLTFENLEYVTSSMLLAQGTFYTLLLAAIYLPAALLLREHGTKLIQPAASTVPAGAVERWLRDTSVAERIPRVLAILSPILAGPAAELLKLLLD